MRPANPVAKPHTHGAGASAKPTDRPVPGTFFGDRLQRGPECTRCLKVAAVSSPLVPLPIVNVEASTCVLGGMRNLSVRCGQNENPKPRSGNHAASRRLAPLPGRTTRREDHAALIVLDEFRTGYSSAGCSPALPASASPARSDYHAFSKGPPPTGHFYFARMRTFLLCLDRGVVEGFKNKRVSDTLVSPPRRTANVLISRNHLESMGSD